MTGPELKAWRAKRGLSQAAIGRLLHVTAQTVYRWEAGTRAIPYASSLLLKLLPAGTLAQQRTKPRP